MGRRSFISKSIIPKLKTEEGREREPGRSGGGSLQGGRRWCGPREQGGAVGGGGALELGGEDGRGDWKGGDGKVRTAGGTGARTQGRRWPVGMSGSSTAGSKAVARWRLNVAGGAAEGGRRQRGDARRGAAGFGGAEVGGGR